MQGLAQMNIHTKLYKFAKELSDKQKEAGNYQKGHRTIAGLNISIENPAGSIRSGTDNNGNDWSIRMNNHYGYIKGTTGKDKDHLDCFIKVGLSPNTEIDKVHIVNQKNPESGEFDEHKVMIGWDDRKSARKAYYTEYEKGWSGVLSVVTMPINRFKEWCKDKKKTKEPAPSYNNQEKLEKQSGEDNKADTHGTNQEGYIAVDLDGTLAKYDGWKGASVIGEPIKPMLNRVKQALEDGKKIKILTARASGEGAKTAKNAIRQWCKKHIGQELPITATKDRDIIELWDDRAIQVKKNTGNKIKNNLSTEMEKQSEETNQENPSKNSQDYIGKINAPMFAYKTVHGKLPDFFLSGRTNAPKKIWRGVDVDEVLDENVLEQLNDIPEIEGRSSEAGKDENRPAFFIFRLNQNENKAEDVAEKLRQQGIKSLAEIGQGGRPRIIAAENIKYGDKGWEQWWESLPSKIKQAVQNANTNQTEKTGMDNLYINPKLVEIFNND